MAEINYQEVETKVIAKCWKDPAYKARFLNNPKEAIRELGYEIPEEVSLVVHRGKENVWNFLLPPEPANVAQLSEADLEKVAAGGGAFHETYHLVC